MNSKEHLYISLAKSFIRMIGGGFAIQSKTWQKLAFAIVVAELLGILEELFDRR